MAAGAPIGAIKGEIGGAVLSAERWEAICGSAAGSRDRSFGRKFEGRG
jgi:hypothetical protein